jgi:hypothetical protein
MHPKSLSLITLAVAATIPLFIGAIASAQQFKGGTIVIEQPWARATPGGADVAGGYLTITNIGKEPDRLVSVSSPRAGRVEVHEMKMEDGVSKMRPVPGGIEIGPGQKVELKPNGYHVMFMNLRAPFKQGETVKGQLRFEKAGTLDIGFKVSAVGAQGPEQGEHHGH